MAEKKDYLSTWDLSLNETISLLVRAEELRLLRRTRTPHATRPGAVVGLIFEKASTRTRVSFETAAFDLGGHAVVLSNRDSQLGRGEPIRDTARVLSGYCHALMIRTFGHDKAEELAHYATVPVINGLTDKLHPCQILADLQTVLGRRRRKTALRPPGVLPSWEADDTLSTLRSNRYAWIGDGNNVAHSWIEMAGLLGLDLSLACPEGYMPDASIVEHAREVMARTGSGRIEITTDPVAALSGCHVISTDVFTSMGQEEEAAERRETFAPYCLNADLLAAAEPEAMVLHCLPAHRGEEITDEVLEGPQSAVFAQAENRLHAQKALLEYVLGPFQSDDSGRDG